MAKDRAEGLVRDPRLDTGGGAAGGGVQNIFEPPPHQLQKPGTPTPRPASDAYDSVSCDLM